MTTSPAAPVALLTTSAITSFPQVSTTVSTGATLAATETPAALSAEPPIVLISSEDNNGGTTVHLTSLNNACQTSLDHIASPRTVRVAHTRAIIDDHGTLYLPTTRLGAGTNDVLYIVSADGLLEEIDLRKEYLSYSLYSFYGKIMVASSNSVGIIENPSSPLRTIRLRDINRNTLVEGQEGEVIALGESPVQEDGAQFVKVLKVDLDSGQVTEKLLPAPQTERVAPDTSGRWPTVPGAKYGLLIFIGVSPDLGRLYYIYQTVIGAGENAFYTRLGVFDTEKEAELPLVYEGCCPPFGGYLQYRNYLMVSHFPEAGGSALLLNMKEMSPVSDFAELLQGKNTSRLTIHPFGKYFILGLDEMVLLLSHNGSLLKEYPFPPGLIGKDYTIVEYHGEGNPSLSRTCGTSATSVPSETPSDSRHRSMETVSPSTASSEPGGWQTYTNTIYGFAFSYPPDWETEEKPSVPNFVWLKHKQRPALTLIVGFRWSTEEAPIQRTGVGAGDLIAKGSVSFLGQKLSRDILVYQGKEKAILYNYGLEIEVDDLVFTLSLDDRNPDYASVVIEQEIQTQIDHVVESFK